MSCQSLVHAGQSDTMTERDKRSLCSLSRTKANQPDPAACTRVSRLPTLFVRASDLSPGKYINRRLSNQWHSGGFVGFDTSWSRFSRANSLRRVNRLWPGSDALEAVVLDRVESPWQYMRIVFLLGPRLVIQIHEVRCAGGINLIWLYVSRMVEQENWKTLNSGTARFLR